MAQPRLTVSATPLVILMAAFQYRLRQVFKLRERKKKEQEQKVIEAQQRVRQVELQIEEKKQEIRGVRQSMLQVHHTLMPATDKFLEKLGVDLEALYEDLKRAKDRLAEEQRLLVKAQADLQALVKHRDKLYEEWQEEEKRQELKKLDEVAGQRYYRAQQDELEEQTEWQARLEEDGDAESDENSENIGIY